MMNKLTEGNEYGGLFSVFRDTGYWLIIFRDIGIFRVLSLGYGIFTSSMIKLGNGILS